MIYVRDNTSRTAPVGKAATIVCNALDDTDCRMPTSSVQWAVLRIHARTAIVQTHQVSISKNKQTNMRERTSIQITQLRFYLIVTIIITPNGNALRKIICSFRSVLPFAWIQTRAHVVLLESEANDLSRLMYSILCVLFYFARAIFAFWFLL